MKKIFCFIIGFMMFAGFAFAADTRPSQQKIDAAIADFDSRFVPIMNYYGNVTSISMGYDVDKPGLSVSWQRTDGVIEQYGSSFTPYQYSLMLQGGSSE
jgi:hypothetical protein